MEPPRTNPFNGRDGDSNPGTLDYKFSARGGSRCRREGGGGVYLRSPLRWSLFFCLLLKIVYLTSQLWHSLVVCLLQKKNSVSTAECPNH